MNCAEEAVVGDAHAAREVEQPRVRAEEPDRSLKATGREHGADRLVVQTRSAGAAIEVEDADAVVVHVRDVHAAVVDRDAVGGAQLALARALAAERTREPEAWSLEDEHLVLGGIAHA